LEELELGLLGLLELLGPLELLELEPEYQEPE
jgi:hypothetical protein